MQRLDPLYTPLAGFNLIEASAGTGKTYTITALYARLVVEAGIPVHSDARSAGVPASWS